MDGAASIPTFRLRDVEFDPGTVEFAIRRIEDFSAPALRPALNKHRTDFYHIIWITGLSGEGKIWIDLDCYPVKPHLMCFISPGQIRAWEVPALQATGGVTGYAIAFTSEFFSNSPDDTSALIQLPYFHGVGAAPVLYADEERAGVFTVLCQRLERETELALDSQVAILHSYMRILLVEARRFHVAQPGAIRVEETHMVLTKQFIQLVDAHYLDTSSVADYAEMLHVTANHLVETVRRAVGVPPGKIIHERLLLEAKRLLRYSDLPIAEIATQLNFEDPSYFSRFFKKHSGFSPSEFREQP
jgi:AraC family transcriptional regulator, transcriptional activator of pobA